MPDAGGQAGGVDVAFQEFAFGAADRDQLVEDAENGREAGVVVPQHLQPVVPLAFQLFDRQIAVGDRACVRGGGPSK